MPSISSIIVAAAALLTISAPIAACSDLLTVVAT